MKPGDTVKIAADAAFPEKLIEVQIHCIATYEYMGKPTEQLFFLKQHGGRYTNARTFTRTKSNIIPCTN